MLLTGRHGIRGQPLLAPRPHTLSPSVLLLQGLTSAAPTCPHAPTAPPPWPSSLLLPRLSYISAAPPQAATPWPRPLCAPAHAPWQLGLGAPSLLAGLPPAVWPHDGPPQPPPGPALPFTSPLCLVSVTPATRCHQVS